MDGITDTRRWAIEVGLEVGSDDPEVQRKRRKLLSAVDPPKYILNSPLEILTGNADEDKPSPSDIVADVEENEVPASRKGKEEAE